MGFKLVIAAQDHFAPLIVNAKGRARRDPHLERVLEYFARYAWESNKQKETYQGWNIRASQKFIADKTGMNRDTVHTKLEYLKEMGVLSVTGKMDSGADIMSLDLTAGEKYKNTPYVPVGHPYEPLGQVRAQQSGTPDPAETVGTPCPTVGHPPCPTGPQTLPNSSAHIEGFSKDSKDPSFYSLSSSDVEDPDPTSFTEAQSARGAEEGEENDDQGREGEGDSTSITDPDDSSITVPEARLIQSEELHASSITADSVPLSGHDVSSGHARETPSALGSSQVEESPTVGAQGSQNGAQPLQNPEGNKPKHFTWRPHHEVWEQMKATAPDIDLELVLSAYITWCIDNRKPMNNSQWSSWVEKRQGRVNDQKREEEEKRRREESLRSNWTKKNGWHL